MKSITKTDEVKLFGTILCVFAHPDDETLCCGGIMSLAVKNGQRVVCLTATRGEKGIQDESRWPAEQMGDIREAELKAALELLGVSEHHWLGFMDGEMDIVPDDVGTAKVQKFIEDINPDTIFTFPADGLTGHPDHKAICRWTIQAAKQANSKAVIYHAANCKEDYEASMREANQKYNFYFAIDKPNLIPKKSCSVCLCLPDEVLDSKIRAVKCMASQYETVLNDLGEDWAKQAFKDESFMKAGHE
jgi:LmbE family N-acetylglucosaminyl deacetylase